LGSAGMAFTIRNSMKILPLPTVEKGCIVDCDWDGEGI